MYSIYNTHIYIYIYTCIIYIPSTIYIYIDNTHYHASFYICITNPQPATGMTRPGAHGSMDRTEGSSKVRHRRPGIWKPLDEALGI